MTKRTAKMFIFPCFALSQKTKNTCSSYNQHTHTSWMRACSTWPDFLKLQDSQYATRSALTKYYSILILKKKKKPLKNPTKTEKSFIPRTMLMDHLKTAELYKGLSELFIQDKLNFTIL